ncbi:MAG: hypothetical protein Kow0056_09520 [Coriobacteriia bacterium]
MRKRITGLALLPVVAVCTLLARPAVSEAESRDFGVLYIGNYSDADARYVRDRFLAEGWNQEVFKTSRSTLPGMWPAHYHFTHGPGSKMAEAGDDCDFLYVSGHGYSRAKFPIFRYGVSAPVDSISPDTNCTNDSPWEVGIEWKGKFPSNESRWDYDIEWAVFAACSQLDWRTPPYAPYAFGKDSAAKAWARTLLGEPGRMHSIFGYWGKAPAGNTDTAIARRFLDAAFDDGTSVLGAWMRANQAYGTAWAAVTHAENRYDRLHGVGSGATPDTSPFAKYHIDYYCSTTPKRILDGRGGSYEQMSNRERPSRGEGWTVAGLAPDEQGGVVPVLIGRAASALSGIRLALAAPSSLAPPALIPGPRARVEVNATPEGQDIELPSFTARSWTPRVGDIIPGRRVSRIQEAGVLPGASGRTLDVIDGESRDDICLAKAVGHGQGLEGHEVGRVWESGRFEYHSGRGLDEAPARLDEAAARRVALQYAQQAGLPGLDGAVCEVTPISRMGLSLYDSADTTPEVVAWQVRLTQTVDGVEARWPGSGALLMVDGEGVCDAYGDWLDPESLERVASARRPVPAAFVLDEIARRAGFELKVPERFGVWEMELAMGGRKGPGGRVLLRPAWRCELDDGAECLVDAQDLTLYE